MIANALSRHDPARSKRLHYRQPCLQCRNRTRYYAVLRDTQGAREICALLTSGGTFLFKPELASADRSQSGQAFAGYAAENISPGSVNPV